MDYFLCCLLVGVSERKRRRNKSAGTATRRRRSFQFGKENEVPEDDQNNSEEEEEFLEKNVSDIYQAEGESTQNYFLEESASVLQEQQTKSNEIAFSGIDGERSGGDFDND